VGRFEKVELRKYDHGFLGTAAYHAPLMDRIQRSPLDLSVVVAVLPILRQVLYGDESEKHAFRESVSATRSPRASLQ
jgi:hypothetical protein